MTDRTPPDDAFDDPYGDGDPFDDADDLRDDPFSDVRDETGSPDPFDLEPVLEDEDDYQNTPNSYNVRNIVLIASGGFVLVLVVFLFSMGGSGDPAGRLQVEEGANGLPLEATPPDISLRPVDPNAGLPADDDLAMLLEDPALAQGGYGSYASTAPPPPRSSRGGGAAPAGDREPTYRDLRREAFRAALGGQRPSVAGAPSVPENAAVLGQPQYVVDAAGNVLPLPPGYAEAYQSGAVQQASQWSGGVAAPSGGSNAMRQAETQAQPRFSPFTLAQGTLINVVLETAVHSDVPGLVTFRTTEDVYDRHRRYVLIPRGSQITAFTDEVVGDRLIVDAARLNLPDGRSVDFANAALHDAQGRLGLTDEVDRHTLSRVGAGALQAATGVASTVAGRRVGRRTVVIRNADGSISEVPIADDIEAEAARRGTQGAERSVREATRGALNRPNTIRLNPGLRAVVALHGDVDLGGPYYQTGSVPAGRSPYDVRPQRQRSGATPAFGRPPQIPDPPAVRGPVRTAGVRR